MSLGSMQTALPREHTFGNRWAWQPAPHTVYAPSQISVVAALSMSSMILRSDERSMSYTARTATLISSGSSSPPPPTAPTAWPADKGRCIPETSLCWNGPFGRLRSKFTTTDRQSHPGAFRAWPRISGGHAAALRSPAMAARRAGSTRRPRRCRCYRCRWRSSTPVALFGRERAPREVTVIVALLEAKELRDEDRISIRGITRSEACCEQFAGLGLRVDKKIRARSQRA